jgi:Transglutaminase-like superfamily
MPSISRISFGLVDGRPVFMDILSDSYFRLDGAAEAKFMASLSGRKRDSGPALEQAEAAACPRAERSALDEPSSAPRLADLVQVWRLVRAARSAIGRQPIADVLGPLTQWDGGPSGPGGGTPILELARRFAAARRLIAAGGNCLSNSLALLEWLGRHNEGAALIFGVKLDPFAAHCWVQSGVLLLNDLVERTERFTPVRVVECKPATP